MRSSPRLCVVNNIFGYTKRVVVFCALRVSDPMCIHALCHDVHALYTGTRLHAAKIDSHTHRFAYASPAEAILMYWYCRTRSTPRKPVIFRDRPRPSRPAEFLLRGRNARGPNLRNILLTSAHLRSAIRETRIRIYAALHVHDIIRFFRPAGNNNITYTRIYAVRVPSSRNFHCYFSRNKCAYHCGVLLRRARFPVRKWYGAMLCTFRRGENRNALGVDCAPDVYAWHRGLCESVRWQF